MLDFTFFLNRIENNLKKDAKKKRLDKFTKRKEFFFNLKISKKN
jgi:hypothetical protein